MDGIWQYQIQPLKLLGTQFEFRLAHTLIFFHAASSLRHQLSITHTERWMHSFCGGTLN